MIYHDIKLLHLFMAISFIMWVATLTRLQEKKIAFVLSVFFAILTFATGSLLMARFGVSFSKAMPNWITLKIVILLTGMALTYWIKFKWPKLATYLIWVWQILLFIIIGLSVYKPL